MNVLLIVVDSLRKCSLEMGERGPWTPFLRRLDREAVSFERAYATECWTLPSHCSMFTGLLPSQHGAHFQSMAYEGESQTIAEILSQRGYATEIITRNFIFDGTIPGINRGFGRNTCPLSDVAKGDAISLFLAAAKPRFRRHLRDTGFFHPFHRDSREFLGRFARALRPADDRALDCALRRMEEYREAQRPYFLFCNLYDVHAPYSPTEHSVLRPWDSSGALRENLSLPYYMSRLGAHRYLRNGFRLSETGRAMLLRRYHRAVELMDRKLEVFFEEALASGLLDDTLLILTSDHGEAFGEHELFLHDASVYDTHLRVPLWVYHPELGGLQIDDVVSTRDLFDLMNRAASGDVSIDTILDEDYRSQRPIALAEHLHYPNLPDALPRFRVNQAAAIAKDRKVIVRGDKAEIYRTATDPDEKGPTEVENIPEKTSALETATTILRAA